MTEKTLTTDDLMQFTGTEQWYRHPLPHKLFYTEGVQYVAEHGEAYWLLDEIAFAQSRPILARERFQFWKLCVETDHSATLTCAVESCGTAFTKKIEWTDFPLNEISFYLIGTTILLPSEY